MASTNGLPVPALSSANNPPADFLALANAVDAAYGGSVANWAALPATGNFAGKRLWVSDIQVVATWNGTGWVQALPVSSTGISAAAKASTVDSLGVGLVNVVPSSVTKTGTSATLNTVGLVTFTGCSQITLNGVFTTDYSKYKIVITTSFVSAAVLFRLRFSVAGTPDSGATNYGWEIISHYAGANLAANASSGNAFIEFGTVYQSGPTPGFSLTELVTTSPQKAAYTFANFSSGGSTGANTVEARQGSAYSKTTTQYDGIQFYSHGAQTMDGTIQIFGFNE